MPTAPSSTPASDPAPGRGPSPARARRFLAVAALALVGSLAVIAARVVWFDAYWVFRAEPPWRAETAGANRLLDRQTRRAKVLQALTRPYRLALVGSSTVYHGLDPADLDPDAARGGAFNAGISALIASELPVVAGVVASRGGVERVVVGLDYYMFSRPTVPVHLDPALASASGRLAALMGAVLGRYALEDSRLTEVAGGDDPGAWTHDGFRITPPLPPTLTRENDATRRRTAAPFRPESLDDLALALDRFAPRPVTAYLSPVSAAQRRVLADAGLMDDFARWRTEAARVATEHGARVLDLVDLGDQFPFDPDAGSNEAWLDNLHYTPRIGRLVLAALGLRREDGPDAGRDPGREPVRAPGPMR